MKTSKELQIVLESLKVVLLDGNSSNFEQLLKSKSIDWKRVKKMLIYHQIRPIFYEAAKRVNFQNETVEMAGDFSKKQAIKNINHGLECISVLNLFSNANIPALPYKGLLFIEKFYNKKPLREIGDLDILVEPHYAVAALKLLIEDGYKLNVEGDLNDVFLTQLIQTTPSPEVGLDKVTPLGMNVHIDFHWGLNEAPQYQIEPSIIFSRAVLGDFQNEKTLIPDIGGLYQMLLNHHGSRECWVKLKHMADLIAFTKAYPKFIEKESIELSKDILMKKINIIGNELLDIVFCNEYLEIPKNSEALLFKRIISMWEYSTHWNKIIPKILLLRIYRQIQDNKSSWSRLIHDQIKFHSRVNLTENKRVYVLPPKYVFLNAFSKLISYIIRVYIKPWF